VVVVKTPTQLIPKFMACTLQSKNAETINFYGKVIVFIRQRTSVTEKIVDIRKRIEEMRNEVTAAIAANKDSFERSKNIDEHGNIEIGLESVENDVSSIDLAADRDVPNSETDTKALKLGAEEALKLPSFKLNIQNQNPTKLIKLLVLMLTVQVITSSALIYLFLSR
jgi:hypothetical protein